MTRTKTEDVDHEGGFLARWSQRKQQVGSEEPAAPLEQTAPAGKETVELLPTDADMPPIDSLTEESDYSGFLSPRVSDELRRVALRKLFRSADFNLRDGLDDYDDDYTAFAKLGNIITAEMRRRLEAEEQRRRESSAEGDFEEPAGETVPEQSCDRRDEGDAAGDDRPRQLEAAANLNKEDADRKEGPET